MLEHLAGEYSASLSFSTSSYGALTSWGSTCQVAAFINRNSFVPLNERVPLPSGPDIHTGPDSAPKKPTDLFCCLCPETVLQILQDGCQGSTPHHHLSHKVSFSFFCNICQVPSSSFQILRPQSRGNPFGSAPYN